MNYSNQELVSNVYRAGTSGTDIGTDSHWAVGIVSRTTAATVFVHAPNASTAKRIAKQYAQRLAGLTGDSSSHWDWQPQLATSVRLEFAQ